MEIIETWSDLHEPPLLRRPLWVRAEVDGTRRTLLCQRAALHAVGSRDLTGPAEFLYLWGAEAEPGAVREPLRTREWFLSCLCVTGLEPGPAVRRLVHSRGERSVVFPDGPGQAGRLTPRAIRAALEEALGPG